MTKRLSSSFFGDKLITENIYHRYLQNQKIEDEDIKTIFHSYTTSIENVYSPQNISLLEIFVEFIHSVQQQFQSWPFQQFSSVLEIAAHVFQYSFKKWLTKDESFKYFSEVIVRHSLFRPPHSICVFNYEELNQITRFWIDNFVRFYEEYRQCMGSTLEEVLECHPLPGSYEMEANLREGKIKDRAEVEKYLK